MKYRSVGAVVAAAFGWATLGPLVLLMPTGMSAECISALRGLWIFVAFLALVMHRKIAPYPTTRVVVSGGAYALSAITYIMSLKLIPVAAAAPLHYTTPALLIVGLCVFSKHRTAPSEWIAVGLSVLGSGLMIIDCGLSNLLGVATAVGSAALWALYLAIQKRLRNDEKTLSSCYGGAMMVLVAFTNPSFGAWTQADITSAILIGAIGSIAPLLLLATSSSALSPVIVSLVLLLEPIFATGLAWGFNGQIPTVGMLFGLLSILTGAGVGVGVGMKRK